jgi:hypothetical protein
MSESEWMAFTDPWDMLDQIRGSTDRIRGPVSKLNYVVATDRQLLLWGSGCCRRLGPFVDDARWLNAIQVIEQFADGKAAYPDVLLVGTEMEKWFTELGGYERSTPGSIIARSCADLSGGVDSAFDSMRTPFLVPAYDASRWAIAAVRESAGDAAAGRERAVQCSLLHDVLGNPFHPVVLRDGWQTAPVLALADEIYRGRAFGRLPELAGALADAGCDNEAVLSHCRSAGPHVRGCWVVDRCRCVSDRLRWT